MSRRIDLNVELSDEDVEYLEARGAWGQRQLAENKALLSQHEFYRNKRANQAPDPEPEMSDEEKVKLLEEAEEWISNAKVPELQARLSEEGLPADGKQADLRTRLMDLVTERYS